MFVRPQGPGAVIVTPWPSVQFARTTHEPLKRMWLSDFVLFQTNLRKQVEMANITSLWEWNGLFYFIFLSFLPCWIQVGPCRFIFCLLFWVLLIDCGGRFEQQHNLGVGFSPNHLNNLCMHLHTCACVCETETWIVCEQKKVSEVSAKTCRCMRVKISRIWKSPARRLLWCVCYRAFVYCCQPGRPVCLWVPFEKTTSKHQSICSVCCTNLYSVFLTNLHFACCMPWVGGIVCLWMCIELCVCECVLLYCTWGVARPCTSSSSTAISSSPTNTSPDNAALPVWARALMKIYKGNTNERNVAILAITCCIKRLRLTRDQGSTKIEITCSRVCNLPLRRQHTQTRTQLQQARQQVQKLQPPVLFVVLLFFGLPPPLPLLVLVYVDCWALGADPSEKGAEWGQNADAMWFEQDFAKGRGCTHITSHHVTSHTHHITSHHITSHHTHIISHHITSHHTHITSHHITSHHITSYHVTSHHITHTWHVCVTWPDITRTWRDMTWHAHHITSISHTHITKTHTTSTHTPHHAQTSTRTYAHIHTRMHTHIHAHKHNHTHIHTHARAHVHTHTYTLSLTHT